MITLMDKGVYGPLHATIRLGRCKPGDSTCADELGSIWANFRNGASTEECEDHACPADHILMWPNLERVFTVSKHFVDESPLGERDVIWMLKMSFTQMATGHSTQSLSLTHISMTDRPLLKMYDYQDMLEMSY